WLQRRGHGSGVSRLTYLLNPLLPCASPLVGTSWVARLSDLLPALEETAGRIDQRQTAPVDTHIAAFVSARLERRMDDELKVGDGDTADGAACLAQLRMLALLQSRNHSRPC